MRCTALSAVVRPLLRGLSRATGIATSVIMPTCDKATYLDLTLATLERQVFPSDLWELIVIDDSSADTTPQVLKFYEGRGLLPLVHQRSLKNRGRAGARNDALQIAQGHTIIFLDDDRLTGPDFLLQHALRHRGDPCVVHGDTNQRIHTHLFPPIDRALLQRLRAQGWGNVLPHHMTAPERFVNREDLADPRRLRSLGSLYVKRHVYQETSRAFKDRGMSWLSFTTGNSSVLRDQVRAIGGFDEEFRGWGFEDNDLALRLQETGLPLHFEPTISTLHQVHPTGATKVADHRRNMRHFFCKHPRLDRTELEPLFTLKVPPDQWIKQQSNRQRLTT
jgi:glycosyltransferase involved in cell wall biosynthesis